jgi:uncharacterized protein (TIGR03435 family)
MRPGSVHAEDGPYVSVFDALNKQMGLKLDTEPVPTPVIAVDSVSQTPTANPPWVEAALHSASLPPKFEAAAVKPSDPDARAARYEMQVGGRFVVQGMTMSFLLSHALHDDNMNPIVNLPGWASTKRFDIVAKAPPASALLTVETVAPLLHALLTDRFKLKTHREKRLVSVYELEAPNPRLNKASPQSRSHCGTPRPTPTTSAMFSRAISCQNTTMTQFLAQLWELAYPWIDLPLFDGTGLRGSWDFTVKFSAPPPRLIGMQAGAAPEPPHEPSSGLSIFEALEKQLGLKMETKKRSMPVIVVDYLEEKATDN